MSVSARRIARVIEQYIRAREPARIAPRELLVMLRTMGYIDGSYETDRRRVYSIRKKLGLGISQNE